MVQKALRVDICIFCCVSGVVLSKHLLQLITSIITTTKMTDSPSLLSLPAEIRLQIWQYATAPPKQLLLSQHSRANTWISPPLSRTCSQIRNETLDLHFSSHEFIYDLRSPLDNGLKSLDKALKSLQAQKLKLRTLRLKHVNRGVLAMEELEAWIMLFVQRRSALPPVENITFCQGPLRYREFAAQAAVALRQLIKLAAGINDMILGSGEESALGEWVREAMDRTVEGRVVMRGLRVAEEFVRGFRAAAGGEVQGIAVLRWATMNGGLIEGLQPVSVS